MNEIWKDIPDFEGLYQVSNLGNVKSLIGWNKKTKQYEKRKKILLPVNGEYKKVCLSKDKKKKTMSVHRIVANVFIPNPNNLPQVNHKDENKYNNCVDNLEWCTHKYNMNHGTKQDRESIIKTKYHILQYDLDDNLIKEWFNLREIEKNTNYKKSNIQHCCANKAKTAYGYKWKYLANSR